MKSLMVLLVLALAVSASADWGGTNWQADADSMDVTFLDVVGPPSKNHGGNNVVVVDNQGASNDRYMLFRPTFDVRTVGATQDSAKLHIFFDSTLGDGLVSPDSGALESYQMLTDWGEGIGAGTAASSGECSWDSAFHGPTSAADWNTDGAEGAGTDYNSTKFATDTISWGLLDDGEVVILIPASAIENVVLYGVKVKVTTIAGYLSSIGFHADDDATSGTRPYIEFFETTAQPLTLGAETFGAHTYGGEP